MNMNDIVAEVRHLIQDTDEVAYRYTDENIIKYVNHTLKRMCIMRPDLFAYVAEIPTVAGQVLQSAPADSVRIMDIFNVVGGDGIIETEKTGLDQTYPQWMNDPAGPCINWMRHGRNANKFFIYPKAPVGQVLYGEYAQSPRMYVAGEDIELLTDVYFPAVVDGTVYLAQSIDDEHVISQRAQMFMQSFMQTLGASVQARELSDTDNPNASVTEGVVRE